MSSVKEELPDEELPDTPTQLCDVCGKTSKETLEKGGKREQVAILLRTVEKERCYHVCVQRMTCFSVCGKEVCAFAG